MEKLYNNILLPDNFCEKVSDPNDIYYLKDPPVVIDVTTGRQLFVDDFLIEKTDLVLEYHKAVKYSGNPILKAEKPWETSRSPAACPKSGGVWFDEKARLFKMWYEFGWKQHIAYATSEDGIHWNRPNLGIVPGINIILPYEGYEETKLRGGLHYLRPDSTTVFIDPHVSDEERYKLFLRNPGSDAYPAIVGVSGDGIHFEKLQFTPELFDRTTIFYNPFRKKWVYSLRDYWNNGARMRSYRECDNFLKGATWSEQDVHQWMACDSLDKPNPYIGYTPQLYNVDAVGYESIMLGLFQITYGPENDVCETHGVPKITELQPMYSRDGYHFSRPYRDGFIPASLVKGTWDRGYIQSVGGVTIIHRDELWFYYIGFPGDESPAGEPAFTNGIYRNSGTGIAKLRRDGFVSLNGDGTVLTRPVTFLGKESMHINAEGAVRAELLDAAGRKIAVSRLFEGNSTNSMLSFADFLA